MATVIRRKNQTIAVKLETTPGSDAWGGATPSAATDFMKADITVAFNEQQIQNPELTGSLDSAASIAGGMKVSVTITCTAKGSGMAGVAPQWGKLMKLCGFTETLVAAVAASAATAGTTSSATLGASFPATAQALRGQLVSLSGNPAAGLRSMVLDYSATKVATIGHVLPAALDATTQVTVPAHTLYAPTSDPTLVFSGTIAIFMDGLLWRFPGSVASWKLDANAGGIGTLTFTATGQYAAPVAGTVPTGIVFDAPQPPVFRQGIARLGGNLVRVSKASFDAGNVLFEPENPEAGEGFDPSIVTGRASKGTFDPLSSVTDTIARFASFRAGTAQSALIGLGTMAGNIVMVGTPRAQITNISPTNRSELIAETVAFDANAPDAGLFMAVG